MDDFSIDDLPDDIRKAVKTMLPGLAVADTESSVSMPPIEVFEKHLIAIRDDLAKTAGVEPENVKLVGMRVYYRVGNPSKGTLAIGVRQSYNPEYGRILEEL